MKPQECSPNKTSSRPDSISTWGIHCSTASRAACLNSWLSEGTGRQPANAHPRQERIGRGCWVKLELRGEGEGT